MDKCKGLFGRLRCNFGGRYDEVPADPELVRAMATVPGISKMTVPNTHVYVCDVCAACGETRQRPPK